MCVLSVKLPTHMLFLVLERKAFLGLWVSLGVLHSSLLTSLGARQSDLAFITSQGPLFDSMVLREE